MKNAPNFVYLIGVKLTHKSTKEETHRNIFIKEYYEDKDELGKAIKQKLDLADLLNYEYNGWYIRINFEDDYLKALEEEKEIDKKLFKFKEEKQAIVRLPIESIKQIVEYSNKGRNSYSIFNKNGDWICLINYHKAEYCTIAHYIILYNENNDVVSKIDIKKITNMSLHENHVKITMDEL